MATLEGICPAPARWAIAASVAWWARGPARQAMVNQAFLAIRFPLLWTLGAGEANVSAANMEGAHSSKPRHGRQWAHHFGSH